MAPFEKKLVKIETTLQINIKTLGLVVIHSFSCNILVPLSIVILVKINIKIGRKIDVKC